MMKIKEATEEFVIISSKRNKLNATIKKFRLINPDYEVLNITIAGTGGQYGGTMHVYVIWRRENK